MRGKPRKHRHRYGVVYNLRNVQPKAAEMMRLEQRAPLSPFLPEEVFQAVDMARCGRCCGHWPACPGGARRNADGQARFTAAYKSPARGRANLDEGTSRGDFGADCENRTRLEQLGRLTPDRSAKSANK